MRLVQVCLGYCKCCKISISNYNWQTRDQKLDRDLADHVMWCYEGSLLLRIFLDWSCMLIFLDVDQFCEMHKTLLRFCELLKHIMSKIGSKSRLTKTKIFTSLLSRMLTCIIIPINLPFERNQLGYFVLQIL